MDNRAIIIEGPDGSGKSVMAHKLGRLLGRSVFKQEGPPENVAAEDIRIRNSIKALSEPVIMDRASFITSIVYAPILFPDRDFITLAMVHELCAIWRPVIYFCNRNLGNAQKANETDGYYQDVQNARWSIVKKYKIIMETLAEVTSVVEVTE